MKRLGESVGGNLNRGRWRCFLGGCLGVLLGLLRGTLGGRWHGVGFPKSGGGDTDIQKILVVRP